MFLWWKVAEHQSLKLVCGAKSLLCSPWMYTHRKYLGHLLLHCEKGYAHIFLEMSVGGYIVGCLGGAMKAQWSLSVGGMKLLCVS